MKTKLGYFPIYPHHFGDEYHGDIKSHIAKQFEWGFIEARKGDVLLFDAYVPHCSARNQSKSTRRIYFFTFNLTSDGDHYDEYYRLKIQSPNNPIFHVSTPTQYE